MAFVLSILLVLINLSASEYLSISESDTFILKDFLKIPIGQKVEFAMITDSDEAPTIGKRIDLTEINSFNFSDTLPTLPSVFSNEQILTWQGSETIYFILVYFAHSFSIYSLDVSQEDFTLESNLTVIANGVEDENIISVCLYKEETLIIETENLTDKEYYWYNSTVKDVKNPDLGVKIHEMAGFFTEEYIDDKYLYMPVVNSDGVSILDLSDLNNIVEVYKDTERKSPLSAFSDNLSSLYLLDSTDGLIQYSFESGSWTEKTRNLKIDGFEYENLMKVNGDSSVGVKLKSNTGSEFFTWTIKNMTLGYYFYENDIKSMQILLYESPDQYYYVTKSPFTIDFYYTDRQNYNELKSGIKDPWVSLYSENFEYVIFLTEEKVTLNRVLLTSPTFHFKGEENYEVNITIYLAGRYEYDKKYIILSYPDSHSIKSLDEYEYASPIEPTYIDIFSDLTPKTSVSFTPSNYFSGWKLNYDLKPKKEWENWNISVTDLPYVRLTEEENSVSGNYSRVFYDSYQKRILYISDTGVYNGAGEEIFPVANITKVLIEENFYVFYSEGTQAELNIYYYSPDLVHRNLTEALIGITCEKVVLNNHIVICVTSEFVEVFNEIELLTYIPNTAIAEGSQFYYCFPMSNSLMLAETSAGTYEFFLGPNQNRINLGPQITANEPHFTVFSPEKSVHGYFVQVARPDKEVVVNVYTAFFELVRTINTEITTVVNDIVWVESLKQLMIYSNNSVISVKPFNSLHSAVIFEHPLTSSESIIIGNEGYFGVYSASSPEYAQIFSVHNEYIQTAEIEQTKAQLDFYKQENLQLVVNSGSTKAIDNVFYRITNLSSFETEHPFDILETTYSKSSNVLLKTLINGNDIEYKVNITSKNSTINYVYEPITYTSGPYLESVFNSDYEIRGLTDIVEYSETNYIFASTSTYIVAYKFEQVGKTMGFVVVDTLEFSCNNLLASGVENSSVVLLGVCPDVDNFYDGVFFEFDFSTLKLSVKASLSPVTEEIILFNQTHSAFLWISSLYCEIIIVENNTIKTIQSDELGLIDSDWEILKGYTENDIMYMAVFDKTNGICLFRVEGDTFKVALIEQFDVWDLDYSITNKNLTVIDEEGNRYEYYNLLESSFVRSGIKEVLGWTNIKYTENFNYVTVTEEKENLLLQIRYGSEYNYTIKSEIALKTPSSTSVVKRVVSFGDYIFVGAGKQIFIVKNEEAEINIPDFTNDEFENLKEEWNSESWFINVEGTSKFNQSSNYLFQLIRTGYESDDFASFYLLSALSFLLI